MNAAVPLLLNHLWQSTIVAGGALLVGLALGRYRPDVRFRVWLVGSLQFLLPLALLVSLGGWLHQLLHWSHPSAGAAGASLPLARQLGTALFVPASNISADRIPSHGALPWMALLAAWACGTLAVLAIWLREWLRIRALVRSARPLDLGLPVRTVSSAAHLEVGVFGVWRPVLFVPEGLPQALSAGELRAVLAHEMCHVRRRDNLWAALQMLVQAVFWFHPLVWWLGRLMARDREMACDEGTLRHGVQANEYAAGLLKVCRQYMSAPAACMAGLSGSDLKQRVLWIAGGALAPALGARLRWLLALLVATAVATPLAAGILLGPAQSRAPAFAVISIRPDKPGISTNRNSHFVLEPNGRISVEQTLLDYLETAFDIDHARIVGLPHWATTARYAIDAEPPPGTPSLTGSKNMQRYRMMLRVMLADRFQLATHYETRRMPVYEIVAAPAGSKFPPPPAPGHLPPTVGILNPKNSKFTPLPGPGEVSAGISNGISGLAGFLGADLGRPVVDKTGITGDYNIHLVWQPRPGESDAAFKNPAAPRSNGPDIFAALKEQLGLQLRAATDPVDILVIDHIARPAAN